MAPFKRRRTKHVGLRLWHIENQTHERVFQAGFRWCIRIHVKRIDTVGLGPRDVIVAASNVLAHLSARDVRQVEPLDVVPDPLVAPGSPVRDQAHALIVGWEGLSRSERHARQRRLAQAAVLCP